eukprot:TRINITY_DN26287_c0_g1_i1.p1 TRINITY_DN26287_c0_g1~~TRINITY_DN26287_c0_g1_i1.p1  ORF type:complete len:642 (-),score=112.96 TRINITY_DN26287_c0_g1_i1:698-2437(-)
MAEELRNLRLDESKKDGEEPAGDGARPESGKKRLDDLRWDNTFVAELPGDTREGGPVRQVLHACYTKVRPSAVVKDPKLVAFSGPAAALLDLDGTEFEREDTAEIWSGAKLLDGTLPYAQCYGGHQFGMWAGQLGDGRAITLGEVVNHAGERWELQLKGAGRTPYSRMADGLAVLRSSVREFLCSEGMHHLGIPTTRALTLVTTGAGVDRDMFYDGNPKTEPGAVVCRMAPSFLRFGSFQIHAARREQDIALVKTLADYCIHHHFPVFEDLPTGKQEPETSGDKEEDNKSPKVDLSKNKYAAWFLEVANRTALLISKWQGVGFTHGVMNTDNMSILGLTIDYGPFGFLDAFDPKYTPNTTDLPGRRYCFANQPDVGMWNAMQLATTLNSAGLISVAEAQGVLDNYAERFLANYQRIMMDKIGVKDYNKELLTRLLNNMAFDKVDYANCFRSLSNVKAGANTPDEELLVPLSGVLLDLSKERKKVWIGWMRDYITQLRSDGTSDAERKAAMDRMNPKYVLRNYLLQTAIDAAEQGDFSEVRQLLKVMEKPYDEHPGMEKYARLPPAWAYRPGVCMLSCSS